MVKWQHHYWKLRSFCSEYGSTFSMAFHRPFHRHHAKVLNILNGYFYVISESIEDSSIGGPDPIGTLRPYIYIYSSKCRSSWSVMWCVRLSYEQHKLIKGLQGFNHPLGAPVHFFFFFPRRFVLYTVFKIII